MRSKHITVTIDLDRVRAAAEAIRAKTGVGLIAVVKADAYGLGAKAVADTLASVADEFAYFSLDEAREVGRPGLVLSPMEGEPKDYRKRKLRPTVSNQRDAARFAGIPVAISVDTGMQWGGCQPADLDELLSRTRATEVFTHANDVAAVRRFRTLVQGRSLRVHAAATALLDYPEAWFDAVRPGLALYRGAVRVTSRLIATRTTSGPVGYSGFEHSPIGIMLGGYSNHVQPGPVVINGRIQRTLEIGMNTTCVSVDPADRVGDEVVLLGGDLSAARLAQHFKIRPHEVLCRYTAMGLRHYVTSGKPA
jgi:alanine racemase